EQFVVNMHPLDVLGFRVVLLERGDERLCVVDLAAQFEDVLLPLLRADLAAVEMELKLLVAVVLGGLEQFRPELVLPPLRTDVPLEAVAGGVGVGFVECEGRLLVERQLQIVASENARPLPGAAGVLECLAEVLLPPLVVRLAPLARADLPAVEDAEKL